jgi:RNA polymerase sigma factor (sigma-70 family)
LLYFAIVLRFLSIEVSKMSLETSFEELLIACRNGDANAYDVLVQRYWPHVRAVVRSRLPDVMRAKFDSHDFVQDVWVSFFRRTTLERVDLANEAALISYLVQMARNIVGEEYHRQHNLKNNVEREISVNLSQIPRNNLDTPSAMLIAQDRWEELTTGLSDRERQILERMRDGRSHTEIGEELGMSTKTVQRLIRRLQGRYISQIK